MSSLENAHRVTRRSALIAGLSLGLGGCLRPLYGPTASGARLQDILAEIEVEPIRTALGKERTGHYLRSELVYDLDGSGQPRPKRYRVAISLSETLQTPIVDTVTGRANSATLLVNADVTLVRAGGGPPILQERATATASYDRFVQRFANIRAARDAEIRVAKALSEQIKTRLAIALSSS